MHEGCVRAARTTDPGHGEMSEMRGVSARHVCTSPPEDSLVRSLSYQTCSNLHPNGCLHIRRVEAAATPHPQTRQASNRVAT